MGLNYKLPSGRRIILGSREEINEMGIKKTGHTGQIYQAHMPYQRHVLTPPCKLEGGRAKRIAPSLSLRNPN